METISHSRAIQRWLILCMALVALMVLIGGLTRLTESGLSIVKWKLISGTLPPLTTDAWTKEFAEYQTSPQFNQVNHDFLLADFKKIFWLEYLHRLVGRVVGLAILAPFIFFAITGMLKRDMLKRGALMVLLVSLQGTVGWVMVASGLQDEPRVAPIKLALHLSLAFTLFLVMLWTYWQLTQRPRLPTTRGISIAVRAAFAIVFLQIIFGALVAGLRAGLTYNSYPLMDGQWLPDGLWTLQPWWQNHLESILTVQFQHRMLAMGVVTAVGALAWRTWHQQPLRGALQWMLLAVGIQFLLGVATLLSSVNIALASAHQLGALFLLSASLHMVYRTTTNTR